MFKPIKKMKTIEGVVDQAYTEYDTLKFNLKGKRFKLFYLHTGSTRVDSGEKVRIYLDREPEDSDPMKYYNIKALEVLNEKGDVRFTYISNFVHDSAKGEWEWD